MTREQLAAEIKDAEQAANFASAYGFNDSYARHSARAAEFRRQVPEGSWLTQGVSFKFCTVCDREEWANGTVRWGVHPVESVVR